MEIQTIKKMFGKDVEALQTSVQELIRASLKRSSLPDNQRLSKRVFILEARKIV